VSEMVRQEKADRIDITSTNRVNKFVEVIMQLKVPLTAKKLYDAEASSWSSVFLTNGGFYVAPTEAKELVAVTRNAKKFPRQRFVTAKQIGIAVSMHVLRSMTDEFSQATSTNRNFTYIWANYENQLYKYYQQLTRDRFVIDEIRDDQH
jgi:hypothetical protein